MIEITPSRVIEAATKFWSAPIRWGENDCAAGSCAAWSDIWGRPDPMGNLRGAYSSARQAAKVISVAGGYAAMCRERFTACGLRLTRDAMPGDMIMVEQKSPFGIVLGLSLGSGAGIFRGHMGRVMYRGEILEAWTCRD